MPVNGLPPYDDNNIFARILRKEIPAKTVYEDEWALAFHDIAPQAPVHVLVVPKGKYCSFADFSASASAEEIAGFTRAVGKIARDLELETPGYRLLFNMGAHGGQEVPHMHVHLFGGRSLGRMIPDREPVSSTPGSCSLRAGKPPAPTGGR
jgi:histidine triad (HIT) family protein